MVRDGYISLERSKAGIKGAIKSPVCHSKKKNFATAKVSANTANAIVSANENENEIVKKERVKKKFIPPTIEEVREYIAVNNLTVNPDTFYKYFEAGEWIDSKGQPVKSWKQKIITWAGSRTNNNKIPAKKIYTAEESKIISPEEEHRMEIEFLKHLNQT